MSAMEDGKRVKCDGDECTETAFLPVALRPMLSRKPAHDVPTTERWLFIQRQGVRRHYCPRCGQKQIEMLSGLNRDGEDE